MGISVTLALQLAREDNIEITAGRPELAARFEERIRSVAAADGNAAELSEADIDAFETASPTAPGAHLAREALAAVTERVRVKGMLRDSGAVPGLSPRALRFAGEAAQTQIFARLAEAPLVRQIQFINTSFSEMARATPERAATLAAGLHPRAAERALSFINHERVDPTVWARLEARAAKDHLARPVVIPVSPRMCEVGASLFFLAAIR